MNDTRTLEPAALRAHLALHGRVPVANGAGEHGVLIPSIGLGFLAWCPNPRDGYGSSWQVMKLTATGAPKSTIHECAWDDISDAELGAIVADAEYRSWDAAP